ncbi:hypothetical protein ACVXHB_11160 [Escherichia coli]
MKLEFAAFLTVRLYADDWTWNDVWYAFLLGGMSGILVACSAIT